MATIKLQPSGNVLIKDGKVSCGCCPEPEGCCPYPAAALVDALYTYEDLPDAIDIDGIPYLKLDPPVFLVGVTLYYENPFGEHLQIEDQGLDSVWAFEGGNNACLLNDAGMEDQFADTYTITYLSDITCTSVSSTVTRESLCVWRGIADDGTEIMLEYFNFSIIDDVLAWVTFTPNCGGEKRGIAMPYDRVNNVGRLNNPIGNYEDLATPNIVRFTVS